MFALTDGGPEFVPGLVRFDGNTVEIDVTSLASRTSGQLAFQLLNNDADNASAVQVTAVTNTTDLDGVPGPVFSAQIPSLVTRGPALELSQLSATTEVDVLLEKVRHDPASGRYTGELRLRNRGPALGRQVVVVFPGLPAAVGLLNPSGATSAGAPYVNFAPAISDGGLASGMTSEPVEVVFPNAPQARFALRPTVLVGPPNRPPVFNSVGPLTVLPGGHLEVPLVATDPDGDRVRFALHPNGPLPTTTLQANGRLVVEPTPAQIGRYTFTLAASDGALEVTQAVTLTVAADPVTTTRVSGKVLATTGAPLPNIPVEIGRFQTRTGADGSFTLELPSLKVPTEDMAIPIPLGDPQFDPFRTGTQTIPFRRAIFDTTTGTGRPNPRRHPNQVTHFIDASMVYGSDPVRALALRSDDGTGRLKTSPGNMPPFNNLTYFPGGPLPNDNEGLTDPTTLFATGDVRANENVGLNVLHVVLLREHNRLADQIHAADPRLADEQIYQKARHMVSALVQHITYNQFLPVLLSANALRPYTSYNPNTDPSLSPMFSVAAFRVGHTLLSPEFLRLDAQGRPLPGGPLSLRNAFFTTMPILSDGVDPYLRGLVTQRAQHIDARVIDAVRNFLFGPPGSGGMDLPVMNIQRGRDMGLPGYNQARADFGLPRVTSVNEITTDPAIRAAL